MGLIGSMRARLRARSQAAPTVTREERLVWIMGSPRSGSTWLLQLLVHPWTLARTATGLDRPNAVLPPPAVMPIDESYLPAHLFPQRARRTLEPGSSPFELTLNAERASDPAYFFASAREHWWHGPARDMILRSLDLQARAFESAYDIADPWIVIKEPNGSYAAEMMFSLLPRARLIFLIRDGRDVVDSLLDATSPGGWRSDRPGVVPPATVAERLDLVRTAATQWVIDATAVQRAFADRASTSRIAVRYEYLRSHTKTELARLRGWLGLERESGAIERAVAELSFDALPPEQRGEGKAARLARPGAWRQNLSPEEQNAAHQIMATKLAELGYPVPSRSGSGI